MHSPATTRWPSVVLAGVLAIGTSVWACKTAHCAPLADTAVPQARSATSAEAGAPKASRHRQHHAHRVRAHAARFAAKPPAADQTAAKGDAPRDAADLTPAVANAQAQMAAGAAGASDTAPAEASAPAAGSATAQAAPQDGLAAPVVLADDSSTVVGADELNDVDRAAMPEKPTKILRPVPETPHFSTQNSDDTWSQASLIGKVFIVLGGCLTLASAARMFVA